MRAVDAVAKRGRVESPFAPCLDDVANERGIVASVGELPLVKIARNHAEVGQVGIARPLLPQCDAAPGRHYNFPLCNTAAPFGAKSHS
jgi:hypothetical protein